MTHVSPPGPRPAPEEVEAEVEAILAGIRADGGRVTAGRRAIVRSLLTAEDHHVTADDLAARVQAEHPDIHRSTVYRTLDALEEMGVIDRITLGSRGAVYHLADHAHHHLVCGRCGAVEEIPAELLAPVLEALADRTAFALDRPRVAITGLCPACRAADAG